MQPQSAFLPFLKSRDVAIYVFPQCNPDGVNYGYDEFYDISENHFAIYDVDADVKDELLISYWTTNMAGNVFKIYGYDEARMLSTSASILSYSLEFCSMALLFIFAASSSLLS